MYGAPLEFPAMTTPLGAHLPTGPLIGLVATALFVVGLVAGQRS